MRVVLAMAMGMSLTLLSFELADHVSGTAGVGAFIFGLVVFIRILMADGEDS